MADSQDCICILP